MVNKDAQSVHILLIGCGPHAERTYLPALRVLGRKYPIRLKGVVELEGQEERVKWLVQDWGPNIEIIGTPAFEHDHQMPFALAAYLDDMVARQCINGVIIATDPTAHMQYALWAARKGLHVLMDKPISSYKGVVNSGFQARKLQRDQELLCQARNAQCAFLINVQRRYRPDFQHVLTLIDDVARTYGIPITSMQSTHADGQWRLPHEILSEHYHGYNEGYGKIAHGGYHIADIASQAVSRSFRSAGKSFDQVGAYSSLLKPGGFLLQQTRGDYRRVFGADYDRLIGSNDAELAELCKNFGEIDANSIVTLYSQREPVSHLAINLIHNSFSCRDKLMANADLYNGNGRVRHEYYNIEQGPYQNIQIHAYHANEERLRNKPSDYRIGGNEHFDIHVFRNNKLIGGKRLETIRSRDIVGRHSYDVDAVLVEQAKQDCVREFIEIVLGIRQAHDTLSDITTHALTATCMSLMYQGGQNGREVRVNVNPSLSPNRPVSRTVKSARPLLPHIRILGVAGSGKTQLIEALKRLNPTMMTFGSTPTYAYEWLRAEGIGDADSVTARDAIARERVFSHVNEHEAAIMHDLLSTRPVAAIRGRADTLITHAILKGKPVPHSLQALLPGEMRPDLLIILTAPLAVIDTRLERKGRRKTGANSLQFHTACQEEYMHLAKIAKSHLPVLTFDTATPQQTPDYIAGQINNALEDFLAFKRTSIGP